MPRGSRPGERRGGRQRGTPNKRTLIKNAVFLAAAAEPNRSPLDFMLALMRDPQVPLDARLDMAATAAPFVHAARGRRARPATSDGAPCATSAKAAAPSGGGDGGVPGGEENPALQPALAGGDEKPTFQPALPGGEEKPTLQPALPGRPEKAGLASADQEAVPLTAVAAKAARPSALRPLSPLEFLMAVMADPDATPRQRMRAAQVAARYKRQTASGLSSDRQRLWRMRLGYKIDPQVARTIREIAGECDCLADRFEPSPADIQKHKTLLNELREQNSQLLNVPRPIVGPTSKTTKKD